jgi:FMN phosphatase YigB (HAD superfamily)
MNKNIAIISRELEKLSAREKILGTIVLFTLVGYLSYTYIFAGTFQRLIDTGRAVIALKTELNRQAKVKQRGMELERQLRELKSELEEKQFESKKAEESLKARNQINKLLEALEKTAKKLSMELKKITVQTNGITKSQEYTEEAMPGAKKGKGETGGGITRSVQVKYIHNVVHIICLSQYRAALEYLAKIKRLPYALSILSVEMTEQKLKSAGTIRTTIDMEIFFK